MWIEKKHWFHGSLKHLLVLVSNRVSVFSRSVSSVECMVSIYPVPDTDGLSHSSPGISGLRGNLKFTEPSVLEFSGY